ncbi:hypothetical protein ACFLR8_05020 [Bacteroidota bacterium]
MDIREFLTLNSSRLNADILADKIEEDLDVFDLVWEIMLEDDPPVSMRAAWSISVFVMKHPYFIEPKIPDVVAALSEIKSESVRRSLLKLLTLVPIPDEQSGFLFELCFGIVESPGAAIAHRAYAMKILYNISETEPELKSELIALFESYMDDESAGIQACSRNLLKQLYREIPPQGT